MDLRQLRYFLEIYDERSVSRAASRLNVAQSAMSFHIAALETELGARLFIRRPRGMSPTAAGERLSQHARSILRAVEMAQTDLRQTNERVFGEIGIGFAHSAMKSIGVPFMTCVAESYPDVRVALSESLSFPTLTKVMRSEVDMAMLYNPPHDSRFISEPVLEERMLCVGLPSIIGETDAPMTFEEVLGLPLVLLQQGVSSRALLDDASLLKRLETRAQLQLNSVQGISGALIAGLGCGIASRTIMRDELDSGRLHSRPVIEPELYRTLYICRLADRPATFLMEAMSRELRRLAREAVERGEWVARLL